MYELMFDLETMDTTPKAIVLSIGAVVWKTLRHDDKLIWAPVNRFMRVLNIQEQVDRGRTLSQSTILWWQQQDPTARAEAFAPVRQPVRNVLTDFNAFVAKFQDNDKVYPGGMNAFWASPATFDFPIWDDLTEMFGELPPWTYRQKYDVRTVVREASYSAKGHKYEGVGIPHTPVYDCERQIDLLTAARNKMARRIGENSS